MTIMAESRQIMLYVSPTIQKRLTIGADACRLRYV